jgi:hypothetical protein
MVMYCSVECQKLHFGRHKKPCREVHRVKENMEREAAPLKSYSEWGWDDNEPQNFFETSVGEFWVRDRQCLLYEVLDVHHSILAPSGVAP